VSVFRGIGSYLGENAELVRLYLIEPVGSFVEFKRGAAKAIEFAQDAAELTICTVEIDDGDFEAGTVESDAFDGLFNIATDRTLDRLDRFVAARDPRDPDRTLDGTHFRCCHSRVYC